MISNKHCVNAWQLYVIIDRGALAGRDPARVAEEAIRGGADVIQWRDKTAPPEVFVREAQRLRAVTRRYRIPLIINDRPEAAAAVTADGVHLGQEDCPIAAARAVIGRGRLVGKSTHSIEQALAAVQEGADYIGVGPVFATPTKPDYHSVGLSLVEQVTSCVPIPVVAIGGIDARTAASVLQVGAHCVAVVRAVAGMPDPAAAARALKTILVAPR